MLELEAVVVALGWFGCARLAYLAYKSWWRNLCDFTRSDQAGAVSFTVIGGPVALLIALALRVVDALSLSDGDTIVEPRKRARQDA